MIKKTLLISAFIAVSSWLIGFVVFANHINNYKLDNSTHTQAVVALTGGRNRIAEAVKILNSGQADMLFISGVDHHTSFDDIKKRQGIDAKENDKKIIIGQKAKDTEGNAVESTSWLKKNHIDSIRLVTSNYHVERSIVEFKSQNPELKIIPHPVYSEKVQKKWWTSWQTSSLIFSEYNKFLYVYISSHLGLRG